MLWFWRKNPVEKLKEDLKKSFDSIKDDFSRASDWISHLDDKHGKHEERFDEVFSRLERVEEELLQLKSFVSFFNTKMTKTSEQGEGLFNKQTAVQGVQTPVQTAVQTAFLGNFSVMERAIVWALLNSDMKLSYEDLAVLLGKSKATIRGQINSIKQKSEGLINEKMEKNGKKRVYINDRTKEILLKTVKIEQKRGFRKGKKRVKR